MSIRAKLAWTFILLLIFGITAISSYSILFIRNYLLQEGEEQILNDTEWLAITIRSLQDDEYFETNLNEAARTSGYRLSVFDMEGNLFAEVPYHEEAPGIGRLQPVIMERLIETGDAHLLDDPESDQLTAYTRVSGAGNPAEYLMVSISKDQIYEPIKTIRWIIYTGMFISMGLVVLVSILFSRYISRPIIQLESAARDIASGNVNRTLDVDRNDEFGTLANSLNQMARRFRADNEEMKRLYEKQSQFFADITHEVRNPLHTIAASLEMLEMDNISDEKRREYIETASRQTVRMSRLFKDLLTLQRYDSDSYFIEKQGFNIGEILENTVASYNRRAAEKGISLRADTGRCMVYADPDKIEQVLENLISNAVKYTNSGEISISLTRNTDTVTVRISDTGIGITEEHLSRLFDRFYRTDKARSRDKGGTGLGLSVVKSILNAHGSDIKVKSRPGKGSEFWFDLPAKG